MGYRAVEKLAGVVVMGLLAALIQAPAHAQNFTVTDASYVVWSDDSGDDQVNFLAVVSGSGLENYPLVNSVGYVPGVVIPAYTDCNCNSDSSSEMGGTYDFSYEITDDDPWEIDATYDIYAASYGTAACANGPCCAGATNEYAFFEYYDEIDASIVVWCCD